MYSSLDDAKNLVSTLTAFHNNSFMQLRKCQIDVTCFNAKRDLIKYCYIYWTFSRNCGSLHFMYYKNTGDALLILAVIYYLMISTQEWSLRKKKKLFCQELKDSINLLITPRT